MLIWGLLGGAAPLLFFLLGATGPGKALAGIFGGAFVGLVLNVCIPKGFPIPKNITTVTCLGLATLFFSMLADGLLHGEIHYVPTRGSKGIINVVSWSTDALGFTENLIGWCLGGVLFIGIPIYFYRKAIRETGFGDRLSEGESFQERPSGLEEELSGNTQTIIVSIIGICCILVLFYLAISFGTLMQP